MTGRLIRIQELTRLTGLSRSTIRRLEQRGEFPPRLRISTNVVAWRLGDVEAWLASCPTVASTAKRQQRA